MFLMVSCCLFSELIAGQKEHRRRIGKIKQGQKEMGIDFEDTQMGRLNSKIRAHMIMSNEYSRKKLQTRPSLLSNILDVEPNAIINEYLNQTEPYLKTTTSVPKSKPTKTKKILNKRETSRVFKMPVSSRRTNLTVPSPRLQSSRNISGSNISIDKLSINKNPELSYGWSSQETLSQDLSDTSSQ